MDGFSFYKGLRKKKQTTALEHLQLNWPYIRTVPGPHQGHCYVAHSGLLIVTT